MPAPHSNHDATKRSEADMYSLSTTHDVHADDRSSSHDETTGLLSAGTQRHASYDSTSSQGSEVGETAAPAAQDGWAGYKEYEHLPWLKRPSVCRADTASLPSRLPDRHVLAEGGWGGPSWDSH